MRYLTFDPVTRELLGAFLQDLQPEHTDHYVEVDEAVYDNWHAYRMAPDAPELELLPPPAPPPPPSEPVVVAAYMQTVQQHMDATAVSYGYDNLLSVVTYADEPSVARYQSEGIAFRAWRSLCWEACEGVLTAVKAGERDAPTPAELVAELPALGLPPPAFVQN